MPDYKVRYASPDDLDLLVPLFDAYRVFYEQPSDVQLARTFLKERLELRESVIFLALSNPGEGLGFVQLYPFFSSVSAKRIWLLNDLFVAEKARCTGVSRALMNAAKHHAHFTGTPRITLSTAKTNRRAQALYESLGYVRDNDYLTYDLQVD
ncbi:MAG TPA: GNAT family N-acetyltransferase [Verrucomicrobiae bacterium]|nr:GNAT family N-acetyltransferase [Verrucomicrobiae bacterium]